MNLALGYTHVGYGTSRAPLLSTSSDAEVAALCAILEGNMEAEKARTLAHLARTLARWLECGEVHVHRV